MSDDGLKQDIKRYLDEAKMMQLATVRESRPWICNVWFAANEELNLYWISSTARRHSQEILDNPQVAAGICLVQDPSQTNRGGLQLEGGAQEVTDPEEVAKALKLYVARDIFTLEQVRNFMEDATKPHRFYRLKPSRIVFFDPSQQESVREYAV